jgi:hypothetical protein
LGLGGSLRTNGPVEAEVVVVSSYKELESINVVGKIVLFDNGPWRFYNTEFR